MKNTSYLYKVKQFFLTILFLCFVFFQTEAGDSLLTAKAPQYLDQQGLDYSELILALDSMEQTMMAQRHQLTLMTVLASLLALLAGFLIYCQTRQIHKESVPANERERERERRSSPTYRLSPNVNWKFSL